MTRTNVVPPAELCDQHLLAEYRELPRVFKLARLLPTRQSLVYTLGPGHVKFFYDKLAWLYGRQRQLVAELRRRGFQPQFEAEDLQREFQKDNPDLWHDWRPSSLDLATNRAWIQVRLRQMKRQPRWSSPRQEEKAHACL